MCDSGLQQIGKEIPLPDGNCRNVTVQLCFILDYTASMKEQVNQAKESIMRIIERVERFQVPLQPHARVELEIAAIAYNDWDKDTAGLSRPVVAAFGGKEIKGAHDAGRTIADFDLDGQFTKDSTEIRAWMDQGLGGGGRIPEELTGALLAASHLKWSAQKRLAIVITDAPCHGKDYSTAPHDDFCDPSSGLTCTGKPERPLQSLRDEGVKVCVFHTGTEAVIQMCEKLQQTSPELIHEKVTPNQTASRVVSLLEENMRLQPLTYILKPLSLEDLPPEMSTMPEHEMEVEVNGATHKHHISSYSYSFHIFALFFLVGADSLAMQRLVSCSLAVSNAC